MSSIRKRLEKNNLREFSRNFRTFCKSIRHCIIMRPKQSILTSKNSLFAILGEIIRTEIIHRPEDLFMILQQMRACNNFLKISWISSYRKVIVRPKDLLRSKKNKCYKYRVRDSVADGVRQSSGIDFCQGTLFSFMFTLMTKYESGITK